MSLRRRLAILVAIGLTPPFLFTVYNTARWQIHLEEEARASAIADARLVSTEISQKIEASRQLLVTMSRYPAIATNEQECTAYFKSIIADFPMFREAAVIDSNGKFHCSTIPIPPDLDVRDRIYFKEPQETGKFTIGVLTQGRVTRSQSIHLSMPYRSADGALSGVIVVILNPDKLAEELISLPWHPHDRVILLDRNGSLVVSFPRDHSGEAEAITRAVLPKIDVTASDTVDTDALHGRPQMVGFAPVQAGSGGLLVMVAIDRTVALARAWTLAAANLAIGLITIFLAIGAVWLATHWFIVRPIRAVIQTARRRERGDTAARFPTLEPLTEFGALTASLSRMSDKVDDLLSQKALLLRELQHRVMNSLNLLSSIFDIQARQRQTTGETREQLARARNRVIAMGTVYRYLYNTNAVDDIEIAELLKSICRESENAYDGPVKLSISVDLEPILMSGTNAIALAMLTHELITNAVKHAYSEGELGPVGVTLKRLPEGGFEYRFADHGRGLPENFQIEKSDSLGMIMITATARQLGGELAINQLEPGTEFVLKLPPDIEQTKMEQPEKTA